MKTTIKTFLFFIFHLVSAKNRVRNVIFTNNCVTFSVSQGTGCAWMCNYCANQLGTNNYYFTNNICTYEADKGCVGNPFPDVSYTCCSASSNQLIKYLLV